MFPIYDGFTERGGDFSGEFFVCLIGFSVDSKLLFLVYQLAVRRGEGGGERGEREGRGGGERGD